MTRNNALEWVYFYSCKFTLVLHTYMKQIWATWLGAMKSTLLLLGNDLSSFSFLMKMTDMAGIIHIAQRLTCAIFLRKYKHYAISFIWYWILLYDKKNDIKENHFAEASDHFADVKYHFTAKIEKNLFCIEIFLPEKIEKSLFSINIFLPSQKKIELKGCIYHSAINAIANPFVYGRLKIQSSIQGLVEHLRWSFLQKYLMKKSL